MVKAVFYVTEHTIWSVVAVHRILQVPRAYKCSGLRSGDLERQCCMTTMTDTCDRDSDTLLTRIHTRAYVCRFYGVFRRQVKKGNVHPITGHQGPRGGVEV
jgi:hypothetical protein